MKTSALICCCVLAAGCGNWSNDDLEFINAMPDKAVLKSKLPEMAKSTGPLTGEGTRRDGLGETSKLYTDTRNASNSFNTLLTFVLGALDTVRTLPPTTRNKTTRIWGPWADTKDNPGFDVRVVMNKVDAGNFTYAVQYRATGGEFFSVVEGAFKPSAKLTKGQGAMRIFAAVINEKLKPVPDWETLDTIEIGYITDMYPVMVNMVFTSKTGQPLTSLNYGYQELENGNGRMGYSLKGTDANIAQLDVLSAWQPAGAGFGIYTVAEGNYKGATHVECWDKDFKTVFVTETWPGGKVEGDQKSCVTVDGFPQ